MKLRDHHGAVFTDSTRVQTIADTATVCLVWRPIMLVALHVALGMVSECDPVLGASITGGSARSLAALASARLRAGDTGAAQALVAACFAASRGDPECRRAQKELSRATARDVE